ncbi:MAG: DUF2461 domain-containing protein [Ignavibacteriales bacterium]|nr:DUF2461 domain-containing protein [Ignavibacteriales bacterium]
MAVPAVNKSVFRIYRDTRFGLDTTPYRANLGLYFWDRGPLADGSGGLLRRDRAARPLDRRRDVHHPRQPPRALPGRRRRSRSGPGAAQDRRRAPGRPGLQRRGDALQARAGRPGSGPPERRASQAQRALRGLRDEDPGGVLPGRVRGLPLRAVRAGRVPPPLADEALRQVGD